MLEMEKRTKNKSINPCSHQRVNLTSSSICDIEISLIFILQLSVTTLLIVRMVCVYACMMCQRVFQEILSAGFLSTLPQSPQELQKLQYKQQQNLKQQQNQQNQQNQQQQQQEINDSLFKVVAISGGLGLKETKETSSK